MRMHGVVTLNDEEIGIFQVDQDDRIVIDFYKGTETLTETLEFASEQGLNFGLQLKPEYGSKD